MTELENVIKGIECNNFPNVMCYGCKYNRQEYDDGYEANWCDRDAIYKDALELLKAYKSKESEWVKMTGMMIPELHGYHMCKNCEWHEDYHNRETLYPYCPACGAKMKNGIKHGR